MTQAKNGATFGWPLLLFVTAMQRTDRSTLTRYAEVLRPMVGQSPAPIARPHRAVQRGFADYRALVAAGKQPAAQPAATAPADRSPLPAAEGEAIVIRTWQAIAGLFDPQAAAAGESMPDRLIAAQLPYGAFLHATAADSPDLHWYHELILLHALAIYALHTGRDDAWAAVQRSAGFHLNETQPDHATGEPWGLFAFLCFVETIPLAEQLLHTVQTRGESIDPVSWMLLGDTLYCIGRYLERTES